MFWEGLSAARDLGRLHDIASILIRYGFGDIVRRLGLSSALEKTGKVLHWKDAEQYARMESPQRVCRALEDLGPAFVKLGQILATRVDLFSPEWIEEFEKLQDQVPPVPFEILRPQLEEDLGAPPEEVFPFLDTQTLAAASIAQVHRARLEDGTEIVLKIRRPGIRPTIEADLRLLKRLAELVEEEMVELRRFRPKEVVRQFTLSLRRELDLAGECRNAERVKANFDEDPNIIVPKVFWQWTGESLNAQEYIDGIPGRNLNAVDEAGLDRRVLARRGANAVLKMILTDGFYHADPHSGNVFYLHDNRIAFIDFGMVGRLSDARRDQVVNLLHGMVEKDAEEVVEVVIDWAGNTQVDMESLHREIDDFIDRYHSVPLKLLNIGAMLTDLTTLLRDLQLAFPPDLALLTKAFISLEGMGRQLDPGFDMVTAAKPFLQRAMLARYAPDAVAKKSWKAVANTVDILTGLPKDLRQVLRSARNGRLQIHVDVTQLKKFGDQLDSAASRLTVGVITAALIIGSSIVMTVEGGPLLFGLPFFGMLGFAGAAIVGIWLLFSIWKSGKHKR